MTKTFDYIVVGSGPGGCAVASVLSSDKKNTVFMLEAGGDHDSNELISNSTNALELEHKHYAEFFWIVPQIHQENVKIAHSNYSNGRLLGGGSSINGEQYVRGSYSVFQKWFDITQDADWHPDNIFKIFKKFTSVEAVNSNLTKGIYGPVHIREAPLIPTAPATKFVQAVTSASGPGLPLPEISDYNNPDTPLGPFSRWQYYQQSNGLRESASTALLKKVLLTRKNFALSIHSTVMKILWKGNKAIGIEYFHKGTLKQVDALRKVILSAGTQTPLLLQHSGIGDEDQLKELGIPVISNLPNVGSNLTNHLVLTTTLSKNSTDLVSTDENALYSFGAFLPDPVNPNLDLSRASEWIGLDTGSEIKLSILQLQPFSKGYAKIKSKDFLTAPLVSGEALADPRDLQFFKDMINNQLIPIANELNLIDSSYVLTSPDPLQVSDNEYLTEYIKTNMEHTNHWQSQCIMGSKDDGAVVDSDGSVYGTKHLTITDNCIIPFPIDGNTATVSYLIGFIIGHKLLQIKYKTVN